MTLNQKDKCHRCTEDICLLGFGDSHVEIFGGNKRHNDTYLLCRKAEKPYDTRLFTKKERKLQYQWYHNFRSYLVGVTGFEPMASWSRTKRDTKLRHTPKWLLELYTIEVKNARVFCKYICSLFQKFPDGLAIGEKWFCLRFSFSLKQLRVLRRLLFRLPHIFRLR